MKYILITGANSYIGTSFETWLLAQSTAKTYEIDTLDLQNDNWKSHDFSKYDTVFHVAGLAHADVGGVDEQTKRRYYQINTDLAVETAKRAKKAGVGQFIFMSSIIVYGDSAPFGKTKVISAQTPASPANFYGDSKLQAEIGLEKLTEDSFRVCILRPPMIYGKNSKGNYPLLALMAKKLPIFPKIDNQRSMLYIDNLCSFIKICIDQQKDGVFFPQNKEYVSTSLLVKEIAAAHGRSIYLASWLNPLVRLGSYVPGKIGRLIQKAFGSLTYEQTLSFGEGDAYCIYDLHESVVRTEKS